METTLDDIRFCLLLSLLGKCDLNKTQLLTIECETGWSNDEVKRLIKQAGLKYRLEINKLKVQFLGY